MQNFLQNRIYLVAIAQLVGTFLIVYFFPYGVLKMFVLLLFWWLMFRPLSFSERVMFTLTSVFFVVMDIVVVMQGKLVFQEQILLGVPAWEFFMWGFTVLHAKRIAVKAEFPAISLPATGLLLLYIIVFSLPLNDIVLFIVSAVILLIGLLFRHDALILRHTAYMLVLGCLYEATGVYFGLWSYPGSHAVIPIPPWFTTMWAGAGFFLAAVVWPTVDTFARRYGYMPGNVSRL